MRYFDTLDKAWNASSDELMHAGLSTDAAHEFITWRTRFDEADYQHILDKNCISIISIDDQKYPPLLKNIFDPPPVLFIRGVFDYSRPRVAVVGTRKMTAYGKQVTEEIVGDLASHGIEIVSGLALGIDGIAHASALHAGGTTAAVLGSGIDRESVYPRVHYNLSEHIIDKNGVLIGEYPPGTLPTTYSFPRRNRIIAGISLATLVIEAPEKSGALITATCSLEYGRDVYAIPHPLTSMTGAGPHKLIREGAYLIRGAHDIIEHLHLEAFERRVQVQETIPDTHEEGVLVALLSREPLHIDEITRKSTLPGPTVIATLTVLEMKGKVQNIGNMMYVIKKSHS